MLNRKLTQLNEAKRFRKRAVKVTRIKRQIGPVATQPPAKTRKLWPLTEMDND